MVGDRKHKFSKRIRRRGGTKEIANLGAKKLSFVRFTKIYHFLKNQYMLTPPSSHCKCNYRYPYKRLSKAEKRFGEILEIFGLEAFRNNFKNIIRYRMKMLRIKRNNALVSTNVQNLRVTLCLLQAKKLFQRKKNATLRKIYCRKNNSTTTINYVIANFQALRNNEAVRLALGGQKGAAAISIIKCSFQQKLENIKIQNVYEHSGLKTSKRPHPNSQFKKITKNLLRSKKFINTVDDLGQNSSKFKRLLQLLNKKAILLRNSG